MVLSHNAGQRQLTVQWEPLQEQQVGLTQSPFKCLLLSWVIFFLQWDLVDSSTRKLP